MLTSANSPSVQNTIWVDNRGIYSGRFTPGALTLKQFEVYLEHRRLGVSEEKSREAAKATPKK